jgi:Tfp pilus assembly protein FimV
MTEKMISRRGAFSLLGLIAALGFAMPTAVLTTSDAEAQAQPTAPTPSAPAPSAQAPSGPATSGMERRQTRRTGREERREARRMARKQRREARRTAREQRREARRGGSLYMKANETTKQK